MKIMSPMKRAQAAAPLQWICDRANMMIAFVDDDLSISIVEISSLAQDYATAANDSNTP